MRGQSYTVQTSQLHVSPLSHLVIFIHWLIDLKCPAQYSALPIWAYKTLDISITKMAISHIIVIKSTDSTEEDLKTFTPFNRFNSTYQLQKTNQDSSNILLNGWFLKSLYTGQWNRRWHLFSNPSRMPLYFQCLLQLGVVPDLTGARRSIPSL